MQNDPQIKMMVDEYMATEIDKRALEIQKTLEIQFKAFSKK
jgi:hypothetical protein